MSHSIKKTTLSLILMVFLFSCQKEEDNNMPNKADITKRLSAMSSLGTVEYVLSKVIIGKTDNQTFTIGDRKVMMKCKAYVIAGIDFSEIKINKIDNTAKSIEVEMPNAKIILMDIPPKEIKMKSAVIGMFRSDFTNAELNTYQALAEADINKKIKDMPILQDAKKNGRLFLNKFLTNIGFVDVNIIDAPDTAGK